MKKAMIAIFLSVIPFLYCEDRVYLSKANLSFTDEGIFLKKGECVIPLSCIGYDEHGYYLASGPAAGVTLVKCGWCGYKTYWVEKRCCVFEDCIYYCY